MENPNIVRVYEKYKDQGLSIIGVSLDRKAEYWVKAIETDNLSWHHVSNVRYFDEIAALYNVNSIPARTWTRLTQHLTRPTLRDDFFLPDIFDH